MKKLSFYKILLIAISIFLVFLISCGGIYAADDTVSYSDDEIVSDNILCNDSCLETIDTEGLDSQSDLIMDTNENEDSTNVGVELVDENSDSEGIRDSNEEYDVYIEDIQNSSTDRYFSFISYLINDSGFEFRNDSDCLDGYLLYATSEYNITLYDGYNYTILPDAYYFASTNERFGIFINDVYFNDVVYCHNDTYYLDEEYLGWIFSNSNYNSTDLIMGDLNNFNSSSYDNFLDSDGERSVSSSNYPSSYDLRDYGFVTPVKNQGSEGNCWAFATMAALESYLLKFENTTYNLSAYWDLSENNLKNVMSSIGRNGTDKLVNHGGNIYMALAYLLRWSGPAYEIFDPYSTNVSVDLNPIKHVQGVKLIPCCYWPLDNDIIKEAIIQYGAVAIDMYWDYGTPLNSSYCFIPTNNYTPNGEWHAVTIVGWDDNYSRYNFRNSDLIGDGAFIIKNSWGTSSGDNGYYYVSYYDYYFGRNNYLGFSGFVFTDVEDVFNFDYNYNYCPLGLNEWYGINKMNVKFANQWISNKDEVLKAFGLYIKCFSRFSADVFVDGVRVGGATQRIINSPGFYTVDFDQPISILKDQTFRIEISLQSLSSDTNVIPLETNCEYYSKVSADVNQSFIFFNESGVGQWVDLMDIYEDSNICLHAFTDVPDGLLGTSIVANNLVMDFNSSSLFATLIDENSNPVVGKNVSFQFNGGKYYYRMTNENGSFSLPIRLKPGTYDFLISFLGDETYNLSSRIVRVTVNKMHTNINQNVSICYYREFLGLVLRDNDGKALSGQKVAFLLYDKVYKRTTDDEGRARLRINLNNGTHKFILKFAGTAGYYSSTKTFYLTVYKAPARLEISSYNTTFNSSKIYTVKVINNITNRIIDGVTIGFKVYTGSNYKEYNVTTGTDGIARINLSKFSIGNHTVKISSKDPKVVFSTVSRTITINKAHTIVSAPGVTYQKGTNNYFRVTVTHETSGNLLSGLKITLKIYTGSNYNLYNVTTNSNGVASFNTKNLSVGNHSVVISSANSNYYVTASSYIKITN